MIKLPFRFEHWHFDSSLCPGDGIDRYAILDWSSHYNPKSFEHKYKGPRRDGFTGKYYSVFTFRLILARHEFGFRLEYNHGTTTPELAYRRYHDRIKRERLK